MNLKDLVRRADELLQQAEILLRTQRPSGSGGAYVDEGSFQGVRTAILSFLYSTFGQEHPYYEHVIKHVHVGYSTQLEVAIAVLKSARDEMAGGWVFTTKSLVSAEIFGDFLEMGDYLLSEGYKDPAAVIIGSVLEEHLRQLCQAKGIPIETTSGEALVPKKADTMNVDLTRANVYTKVDQQNVTAWLALRNRAAHGKYGEYNSDQVRLMHQGVLEFISRTRPYLMAEQGAADR